MRIPKKLFMALVPVSVWFSSRPRLAGPTRWQSADSGIICCSGSRRRECSAASSAARPSPSSSHAAEDPGRGAGRADPRLASAGPDASPWTPMLTTDAIDPLAVIREQRGAAFVTPEGEKFYVEFGSPLDE